MTFKLELQLGNAMQTAYDIQAALSQVGEKLTRISSGEQVEECSALVMDLNGNRVGQWSISE